MVVAWVLKHKIHPSMYWCKVDYCTSGLVRQPLNVGGRWLVRFQQFCVLRLSRNELLGKIFNFIFEFIFHYRSFKLVMWGHLSLRRCRWICYTHTSSLLFAYFSIFEFKKKLKNIITNTQRTFYLYMYFKQDFIQKCVPIL